MGRMINSIFITLIVPTLIVAGLTLSGCGSGGGSSQEASVGASPVEATTSNSQDASIGVPNQDSPVGAPLANGQSFPDPNSASASPASAPVTDPANTSVSKQLTLAWDQSDGATSYNMYWSTVPGVTPANGTKISSVSSPYVHSNLAGGTTYYYIVTAADSSIESDPTAQVSGSTPL